MKSRKISIHYCEHCGVHRHQKPAMERHEKHCTMNPNRECGMCYIAEQGQINIKETIEKITKEICKLNIDISNGKDILKIIRKECGYCPACVLSVSRQGPADYFACVAFDYEQEKIKFFNLYNEGKFDF